MIQLQYIDVNTKENQGGLYINSNHISSIRNYKDTYTAILLNNGIEYVVPFEVSEVLDMIRIATTPGTE
jgi:uncharacterized protein YlzI (FlbEa/FlbD family)